MSHRAHRAPLSPALTERKRILIVLGFLEPGILAGFARYAREKNWILNAFSVLRGTVPSGWRAHGMLTTNTSRSDLHRFVKETATRIPTVLHGCNDFGIPIPNVECDEKAVGRLAAQHLLEQGHRHFAFFQYSRRRHAILRRDGFRDHLAGAGHGCTVLETTSVYGPGWEGWFRRRVAKLPKPLGLFAEDDILAARVIESAIDAGWRVPEDLAVVGNGNLTLVCDHSQVPITSVTIPFEEGSYQAASLLDRLLSGKPLEKQTTVFSPTGIIARQSTNAVAAQRPVVQRALALMTAQVQNSDLNVEAIASGSGVSTRLLYNEFQTDLKSTPMTELLRLRLRKAKDQLLANETKIGVISESCGFANLRTFQRAFQRIEGQPPVRWRKNRVDRRLLRHIDSILIRSET
jgi:LacI family transcriptional regulator